MSANGADSPAADLFDRPQSPILVELRLAASFLTILPVGPARADNEAVAASFGWFPIVGFGIGVALTFEDYLLGHLFSVALRSALVILSLTAVTGAVHLDALADTADALGAGRDRDRALSILHDSRIGSFGAAAVFLSLALKVIALASISGSRRYVAIFAAAGIARWAMVAVASGLEYLRSEGGAGTALLKRDPGNLALASLATAGALLPIFSLRVAGSAIAAVLLTAAARWFYRRWLGGVTGDLIGACGEIVEIAVLIVFAAF
ncbi:MAG: adenosylcobinamide-GDP ribazoletransferase [Candidatus Binataceae bacterium]